MKRLGFLLLLLVSVIKIQGQNEKMNLFINDLMNKMTVEEKIGQLNLTTAGGFVTGSAVNQQTQKKLQAGQIGGMLNIARDPRWGRIAEGAGEDPWLGSQIAAAYVKGYQGNDLSLNNTMMACVKHFALYGAAEAGRDYNTVDMSRLTMYNEYLPPYKAAIEAGAGSAMTSFNYTTGKLVILLFIWELTQEM